MNIPIENCKQPQSLHLACILVPNTILSVHCQTDLTVGEYLIFRGCGIKRGMKIFSDKMFIVSHQGGLDKLAFW